MNRKFALLFIILALNTTSYAQMPESVAKEFREQAQKRYTLEDVKKSMEAEGKLRAKAADLAAFRQIFQIASAEITPESAQKLAELSVSEMVYEYKSRGRTTPLRRDWALTTSIANLEIGANSWIKELNRDFASIVSSLGRNTKEIWIPDCPDCDIGQAISLKLPELQPGEDPVTVAAQVVRQELPARIMSCAKDRKAFLAAWGRPTAKP